jgi:tetratricopeptide (TPR) repeat protein
MNVVSEAREHCLHGASRHAQGDLRGAIAAFEQALAAAPDSPEVYNNRGATRHALGDLAGARADLDRAVALNPRYPEAYNNRGIVRHAQGDRAGALGDFDRALGLRPRYAEALCNRGFTRQALKDLDGAVADFDRAVGVRPDYAEAYHGRAAVLQAQGDLEGTFADYDQVLRLIPRQAAAAVYHLRGGVRFRQRRFAEAVAELNRALEIEPRSCMAYISRGNARYHLRDRGAQADYRTAFEINSSAAAAEIIRFLVADLQEDAEEVLENCRKHVRICPDDVVAYARRGLTLLLQGNEAEAARDFEECLRKGPTWKAHLELLMETARRHRNQ